MKTIALPLILIAALLAPASAGISESRIESTKKSAAKSGKLIAFLFEQDYYLPNCPKCVQDVNANNTAMKKAVPRKYASLITIDAGETRGLDKLPSVVQSSGKATPRIVITDASCEKVIATLEGKPDRAKTDAFEKQVAEAAGK
jgi:hypothetical protein